MRPTIELDRNEIISKMWNNAYGGYALAVAPDGSDYRVLWVEDNRSWDPWPDGWLVAGIPALDPEGSGLAAEDAEDLLDLIGLRAEAEAMSEAEDIGWVEAIERLAPEDWEANREEAKAWLSEQWLLAINGEPNDLDDLPAWGYRHDENWRIEEIEPPAEFGWLK